MLKVHLNEDKIYNETESDEPNNENMISGMIQPFSLLIIGKSGVGKTGFIENVLDELQFDLIYLSHNDIENTNEYVNKYKVIPIDIKNKDDNADIKRRLAEYREYKKCIIIDDYPWFTMSKRDLFQFSQLMTYISTHTNTSIIVTAQDFLQLQPMIRRLFKVCVIYKNNSDEVQQLIQKRLSSLLTKKELKLIDQILDDKHDFIFSDEMRNAVWINFANHFILIK